MPTVSADGKTYTFTVPAGKYKFNTGEPVTAATFQHALERDLSPKQASYFGATFLTDIQGATGYKGLPAHVSGIKVTGDKLAITLTEKDAGFLSKVATPFACAIPKDTPVNSKGVQSIAGAGPFYIANWVQHRSIVAEEEPLLQGPAAALPERDRLQPAHDRPEPGHPGAQERPARLLPGLRPRQPELPAEPGVRPGGHVDEADEQPAVLHHARRDHLLLRPERGSADVQEPARASGGQLGDRPAGHREAVRLRLRDSGRQDPAARPPGQPVREEPVSRDQPDAADISKAKALIKQAGVKTPLTAVEYSTAGTPSVSAGDAVLQSNLAKIGITLKPKYFTRALQFQSEGVKGVAMDIANEGWIEDYPDPYDFMNILLSGDNIPKTGGNNFVVLRRAEVQPADGSRQHAERQRAVRGVRQHRDGHDAEQSAVGAVAVHEQHRLLRPEGRMHGRYPLVHHGSDHDVPEEVARE